MSNDNAVLAIALGAGAGLGLSYLLRERTATEPDAKTGAATTATTPTAGNRTTPASAPASSAAVDPSPAPSAPVAPASSAAATAATAPDARRQAAQGAVCFLRLDASGLTANGAPIDLASAVALCRAAGRAELVVADDAPGAAYVDLTAALADAGVFVNRPRNARRRNAGSRSGQRFTREGRTILRDDVPILEVTRINLGSFRYALSPHEADQLTAEIVDLLNGRPGRRQAAPDVDLAAFAGTVTALAREIDADPTPDGLAGGRFGGRKVFIAAIQRALANTQFHALTRAQIDRLLLDAHREGLLELARADLTAAMDPDEVRKSEIVHPLVGSRFHFVVSDRSEGRNATTYRHFTVRAYPEGRKGNASLRWFRAEPPVTWATARDRLIAAGIVDAEVGGRTYAPGGWMLSVDPHDYRDERADPLP